MSVADHAGARSFAIVGHSMGGLITQWIAATQQDRVLGAVLLCPVPASGVPFPPDVRALFQTSGGDRGKQGAILDNVCKELSPAAKERFLDDAASIPATCIEQAFYAWADASFADKLGAVKAPTLLVATDDPALPVDFLKQTIVSLIPGAGAAYLPGPGHYLPVERPREAAALLRAFLTALRT
jgi:pimeloyl-ACP methyl ester carboxylesterase